MVFDKLRKAISSTAKKLKESVGEKIAYKELSESDLEDVLDELTMMLVEADVAYDVALDLAEHLKNALVGVKVRRGESVEKIVRDTLRKRILEIVGVRGPTIEELVERRKPGERPVVVVFLGVNGVGKTTTIAKIAYRLKRRGFTPVLAAADTFRAGAQEQLAIHAERVGVPIIRGRYGADPASVAHDAIEYAMSRGFRVVLIDTAGRMHIDYDLMGELRKIVRVSKPDMKLLVVDALTGNDAVEQATKFNEGVGVDAVAVTKTDADVKGGTILSVAYVTRKPILYVGTGQEYGDLEEFDPEKYVELILGS